MLHRPWTSRIEYALRSVFVSDVHLGSRDCRAKELLEFLDVRRNRLSIPRRRHRRLLEPAPVASTGREEHNEVVRAILAKAKEGTQVIYVPGNHDDNIREFCGSLFGNMSIRRQYVHATADGREFLVMHGDEFDTVVKCSRWLASFGAWAYDLTMRLNRSVNACRRLFRLPYWSLATYLKLRLPKAVRYVAAFEHAAAHAARSRDLDGIVCGHIHRPGVREIDGVLYCNDGDWVESCSAIVESDSGELSLWYAEKLQQRVEPQELVGIAA